MVVLVSELGALCSALGPPTFVLAPPCPHAPMSQPGSHRRFTFVCGVRVCVIPSYLPPSLRLPCPACPILLAQSALRLFAPFFYTLGPPFLFCCFASFPISIPSAPACKCQRRGPIWTTRALANLGGIIVESKSNFWNLALFFLIPVSRTGPGLPYPAFASIRSAFRNPYASLSSL